MNPSTKIIIILFVFLINCSTLFAHSPYEISYVLKINQANPTLTVHLTPKTAIDLISKLKPELAQQAVIKLGDYTAEYAKYINKNLIFLADGNTTSFTFQQASLSQHDATLVFSIGQLPEIANKFNITVNCFADLYRKPQNIVKLNLPSGQQVFYLTKQNRHCATSVKMVSQSNNSKFGYLMLGFLFVASWRLYYR